MRATKIAKECVEEGMLPAIPQVLSALDRTRDLVRAHFSTASLPNISRDQTRHTTSVPARSTSRDRRYRRRVCSRGPWRPDCRKCGQHSTQATRTATRWRPADAMSAPHIATSSTEKPRHALASAKKCKRWSETQTMRAEGCTKAFWVGCAGEMGPRLNLVEKT
eukprot:1085638-Rhodomonas_salina.1